MNRGFNYYFREGVKSSAKALYKNKGFLRCFVYFFMETVGRVLLLFNPLFDLANVRQGQLLWRRQRVNISQSFKDAGDPHSLWTYVLTVCVEALIFLAGLILIGIFTLLLGAVGYGISTLSDTLDSTLFVGIFSVPGGILMLVYFVIMPLIFAPTPYVIASNRGIGVGDTLFICFRTMKNCGKWTLFLNSFISLFIRLLILGALSAGTYFIAGALYDTRVYALVMVLWLMICLAIYALTAPIFALAMRSANHHLFYDIMLDPSNAKKTVKGINIKKCNGKKFEAGEIGSALTSVFEETETDPCKETDVTRKTFQPPQAEETVNLADAVEPLHSKRKAQSEPNAAVAEPLETQSEQETAEEPSLPETEITEGAETKDREETETAPAEDAKDVSPDVLDEEIFELETVSGILSGDGGKHRYDDEEGE